MKKKRILIEIIVFCAVMALLIIPNLDNKEFWNASIYQVISIGMALVVSFFAAQRLTERRRKIDFYEKKLIYLQEKINNKNYITMNNTQQCRQEIVIIANLITRLKNHAVKTTLDDFAYIEEQFTEIRQLYDNHINTTNGIDVVNNDIDRHIANISGRIDEILLKLYDL